MTDQTKADFNFEDFKEYRAERERRERERKLSEIPTDYSNLEIIPEDEADGMEGPIKPWTSGWRAYKSTNNPKLKRKLYAIFHRRALEDHPDQIACPYCREKALEKKKSADSE